MPTPCWLKHLCSIRALVPVSCFISLSLFFRLNLWSAETLWVHFPARASKTLSWRHSAPSPHREGAWGLREQSKPCTGELLAFCINQGISASFSLLYFLIGRLRTTRFWSIKGPQHWGKKIFWIACCSLPASFISHSVIIFLSVVIGKIVTIPSSSLIAQLVKNPPAMRETPVWFLDWEDLLEKK